MAKKQSNSGPAHSAPLVTFCTECGSALGGHAATLAANPSVKYCPGCGFQLEKANNTCTYKPCPYYGTVPPGV
jgi:hypothetical protein